MNLEPILGPPRRAFSAIVDRLLETTSVYEEEVQKEFCTTLQDLQTSLLEAEKLCKTELGARCFEQGFYSLLVMVLGLFQPNPAKDPSDVIGSLREIQKAVDNNVPE